jgi:hypothetical protein
MATKKFIIEVEEGRTECEDCPFYIFFPPMCNGAPSGLKCRKINLATMKIKELEENNESKS